MKRHLLHPNITCSFTVKTGSLSSREKKKFSPSERNWACFPLHVSVSVCRYEHCSIWSQTPRPTAVWSQDDPQHRKWLKHDMAFVFFCDREPLNWAKGQSCGNEVHTGEQINTKHNQQNVLNSSYTHSPKVCLMFSSENRNRTKQQTDWKDHVVNVRGDE